MQLSEDFRYALRSLRKTPGFAATAVLAMAVGIGANVAIFSLVDRLLLRPLPLKDPDRLAAVWEDASFIGFAHNTPAPANFVDWKQRNHVFTDMAALQGEIFAITGDGQPEEVEGNPITYNLLPLLGIAPILGRNILPEEDRPGAQKVALISYRLWQQRYGGRRDVIGREILLDNVKHRIIGVMPRGFAIPDRSDIWVAAAFSPAALAQRNNHFLQVYARLKPGIAFADAQREMSGIARQLEREHPDSNERLGAVVVPIKSEYLDNLDLALWVLAGGVGCVLLISCANVAGLLLARGAGRQREMAIRTALGARRKHLVRQNLAESLVIALSGGAAGVLLAWWSIPLLTRLVPKVLSGWAAPRMDLRLLAFALAVSAFSAILFGILPALTATGVDVSGALQAGGRAGIGGRIGLRRALVTGEVALAVVLSVGAGLMVKTVWSLTHVPLGFRPENVLTMRTSLPMSAQSPYRQFEARNAFYRDVLDRVEKIPGVLSAGYTTFLPLTNRGGTRGFSIEGRPARPGEVIDANSRVISRDYVQTMGMRLVAGRLFTEFDGPDAPPVAIVNQATVRQYWHGNSPLGSRVRFGGRDAPWLTIVGVVGDVRQMGLNIAGRAEMYVPYTQRPGNEGFFAPRDLAVRVKGNPIQYADAVRQAVWSVDRNQPIADVQPMQRLVDSDLSSQGTQLWLLGTFAGLALLLAAIGLYGLLAHVVAQRTRDIGVRMALGARQGQVLAAVVRQGLGMVAIGIAIGAVCAYGLVGLMRTLLYGVQPADPATFAAVALSLLIAGALACSLPARRAARIDPMQALRHD